MNHYEILFMVHPDQSDQISAVISKYQNLIKNSNGIVHRLENWGKRNLQFPIKKIHKAYYILLNVECDKTVIEELLNNFRFNDAILRHLIFREKKARTEPSAVYAKLLAEKAPANDGRAVEEPRRAPATATPIDQGML